MNEKHEMLKTILSQYKYRVEAKMLKDFYNTAKDSETKKEIESKASLASCTATQELRSLIDEIINRDLIREQEAKKEKSND